MICKKCGCRVSDSAAFCDKCGASMAEFGQKEVSAPQKAKSPEERKK
ncbi:zinc-ribbon domain-containing protein, partial [Ruminococcus sp.]